jgi:hypothetical protein
VFIRSDRRTLNEFILKFTLRLSVLLSSSVSIFARLDGSVCLSLPPCPEPTGEQARGKRRLIDYSNSVLTIREREGGREEVQRQETMAVCQSRAVCRRCCRGCPGRSMDSLFDEHLFDAVASVPHR